MFSTDLLGNEFFHANMVDSDNLRLLGLRLVNLRLLGFVADTMN